MRRKTSGMGAGAMKVILFNVALTGVQYSKCACFTLSIESGNIYSRLRGVVQLVDPDPWYNWGRPAKVANGESFLFT